MQLQNESLKNNSGLVHGTQPLRNFLCTLLTRSAIPVQRLYQLSKQAIWEQTIQLVTYHKNPWKDDDFFQALFSQLQKLRL